MSKECILPVVSLCCRMVYFIKDWATRGACGIRVTGCEVRGARYGVRVAGYAVRGAGWWEWLLATIVLPDRVHRG